MPLVQHYNLVVVNRIVCDMSEKITNDDHGNK